MPIGKIKKVGTLGKVGKLDSNYFDIPNTPAKQTTPTTEEPKKKVDINELFGIKPTSFEELLLKGAKEQELKTGKSEWKDPTKQEKPFDDF